MIIKAGSTNVSVYYYIVQDASAASPGEPVTGLLFSDIETGGSASYVRQGAAKVDLTLITLASASATHADGGFILVNDTIMPGLYRCDYPDAAFVTGVDQTFLQIVVASGKNAVAAPILVDIDDNVDQTADHTSGIAANATPAQVASALTDIHLDHLFAVDYDPTTPPGNATSLWNRLLEDDGEGLARFTAKVLEASPVTGGSNFVSGVWKFSNDTATTNPGSGGVKVNSLTYTAVTEINISEITDTGGNAIPFIAALSDGDTFQLATESDGANFIRLNVTGPAVDNGLWFTIPVTHADSGTALTNNKTAVCTFAFATATTAETATAVWAALVAANTDAGSFGLELGSLAALISAIGTATGAGFPIEVIGDNTKQDTIDAAAAVDKGSGLVGIPVTGHSYVIGKEITITGTTNYEGSFDIETGTTANEIVITDTFVSETFGGTETINSSFEGIEFVGVVNNGTFASTEADDGDYHEIGDVGDEIDIIYEINVTGSRTAVEISGTGYLNSLNDSIELQAFDDVGSDWETRQTVPGQNGATNIPLDPKLLQKHTGTGVNVGRVLMRLTTLGVTTTAPTLFIDQFLVLAAGIGQSIGYEGKAVHIDTQSANTGTVPFTDGVGDNPTSTLDLGMVIATSVGLRKFDFEANSIETLAQNLDNKVVKGDAYILHLAGFSIDGTQFRDARLIDGVGTASTIPPGFFLCGFGDTTLDPSNGFQCGFTGTFKLTGGVYTFGQSSGFGLAVGVVPIFDFQTLGTSILELPSWGDGIKVINMASGDVLNITGNGTVDIDATCAAGATVKLHGNITTSGDGRANVNLIEDGRVDFDQVQAAALAALVSQNLDHFMGAAVTGADVVDNSFAAQLVSKSATADFDTYDNETDSAEATVDRGNVAWLTGGSGDATQAKQDTIITNQATAAAINTEARLAELDQANLPADIAAVAGQVLAGGDIDGFSLEESQKLILAASVGVLAGADTTTVTIQAADGSKTRITATVDADGNRSVVVTDVTG